MIALLTIFFMHAYYSIICASYIQDNPPSTFTVINATGDNIFLVISSEQEHETFCLKSGDIGKFEKFHFPYQEIFQNQEIFQKLHSPYYENLSKPKTSLIFMQDHHYIEQRWEQTKDNSYYLLCRNYRKDEFFLKEIPEEAHLKALEKIHPLQEEERWQIKSLNSKWSANDALYLFTYLDKLVNPSKPS